MKILFTLAGGVAVVGALVASLALMYPPPAVAWVSDPGPNFMPSPAGEPPTRQRRNQLCIAAWQQSHAFTEQDCKGIWVSWDSYTISPGLFYYDTSEGTHMGYSRCRVHVECRKGGYESTLGFGAHNAVLDYNDVPKLRRCKENAGTTLNTHCDPLTDQDIADAVAEQEDLQDQQSYEDQKYGEGYTGQTFGE